LDIIVIGNVKPKINNSYFDHGRRQLQIMIERLITVDKWTKFGEINNNRKG